MYTLKQLLQEFLETLKKIKKEFNPGFDDVKKAVLLISFQSRIINILDYCYTNFPIDRNKLGQYFPRPEFDENKEKYLNRIKFSKEDKKNPEKNKKHPIKLVDFLGECFEVNRENNSAISLILSKAKHETENKFGDKGNPKLVKKIKTASHPEPVKQNSDGSIEIAGGFIKAEAGANVRFYDSTISTPEGNIEFDHLEFSRIKFEGNFVYLKNNVKKDFLTWANDCEIICSKIINKFNKINELSPRRSPLSDTATIMPNATVPIGDCRKAEKTL